VVALALQTQALLCGCRGFADPSAGRAIAERAQITNGTSKATVSSKDSNLPK
jgi:hypothetical protein